MKIIVLGAGLVGRPMVEDLAADNTFRVAVADLNRDVLENITASCGVETIYADLSDTALLRRVIEPFDIVLDAVPGFMGFQTYKTIIEEGKHVVDIAFFPEDPFPLDRLAREKGVIAIMDMGVAPGMSNILIGYAASLLDEIDKAMIYVGGLPLVRQWPYEYKAPFSPIDVIEEYTRPSRIIRNGNIVTLPALSEPELMDFAGVGTLEAFNSDGLRSLAYTIKAKEMAEKTLRYPGHIGIMNILRETGFFSQQPVETKSGKIRPIDLTSALLFPKWKLGVGEEDLTVMHVMVEGSKNCTRKKLSWNLLDRYDPVTRVHSMARTTGYAATMAVRMIASGLFRQQGVIVPEVIGKHQACVDFILKGLEERGVKYLPMVE